MPTSTTGLVSQQPRLYEGVEQESLTAQSVAATGQWYELPMDWNGLPTEYSWEVIFPSAPTTPSVQLEGTDDSNFNAANIFILDGPYTGTTNTKRWVTGKPIRFVRANLTAIAGGSCTVRITNGGKS